MILTIIIITVMNVHYYLVSRLVPITLVEFPGKKTPEKLKKFVAMPIYKV